MITLISYITAALYLLVFSFSIITLIEISRNKKIQLIKGIFLFLLIMTIVSSLFYFIAQSLWIYHANDDKIFDYEALLWAITEWLVALTLFFYIQGLRVLVNWQCGKTCIYK